MKNSLVRYFIAIVLIGLGTMLVLDNVGVIESDIKELWHYVYPAFFIVLGFTILVGYFKTGGESWIFGSFLIIFGALLLLGRFTVIPFSFSDIFKLWPLLIIYGGFSLIGKSKKGRKSRVHIYENDQEHGKSMNWGRFAVGNIEYKQPNWQVKPMDLRNAAGDYYLDFTKAFIPEEEIPININSWAGDIQILLPEGLEFQIDATVKAGEIDVLGQTVDGINRNIFFESPGYKDATRKLKIMLDLKAGSIRVNQV